MSAEVRIVITEMLDLHTPKATPPSETNIYKFDLADLWCVECRKRWPCPTVKRLKDIYVTESDSVVAAPRED